MLLGHLQEEIAGPAGSHPIERWVVGQDITHPTVELCKLQLSYSVGLVRPSLQGPVITSDSRAGNELPSVRWVCWAEVWAG